MTQEEKQLLLKDLCARLPYGVMVRVEVNDVFIKPTDEVATVNTINMFDCPQKFKITPYLRPMSRMSEEERKELSDYLCEQVMSNKIGITIPPNPTQGKGIPFIWMGDCIDWLNVHHFDYRGLIEKGLALEAPEGMYKEK